MKAVVIDKTIPQIFSQIKPGSTFLTINGYTNNYGEVSNYNLVFHFDYINAVIKTVQAIREFRPNNFYEDKVKDDLIRSYSETIKYGFNSRARSAHVYCPLKDYNGNIINGVKYHYKTESLHLVGLRVNKRVIKPVIYPPMDRLDLIRAKVLRGTPLANYRQFKLVNGRFESIQVQGISLTDDDL